MNKKKMSMYNFSKREYQIISYLLKKKKSKNKEISEYFIISEKTLKKHLCNIYKKVNSHDKDQMINSKNLLINLFKTRKKLPK